jgi:hypothetical protein
LIGVAGSAVIYFGHNNRKQEIEYDGFIGKPAEKIKSIRRRLE